jgi:hypothetical protein
LILDDPSTFSGEIFNFTGNGSLSGSDQIDLKGINYNSVHDSYANGVLTVTDGTDTAELDFNGSYTLANFKFASDGSGGTILYDPPAPTSNAPASGSAYLANSEHTDALLRNYMASSFATASYNQGGPMAVAEASELGRQCMLSSPSPCIQHA